MKFALRALIAISLSFVPAISLADCGMSFSDPLLRAVCADELPTVVKLISQGADPNVVSNGLTSLRLAVSRIAFSSSSDKITRALIVYPKTDLGLQNGLGSLIFDASLVDLALRQPQIKQNDITQALFSVLAYATQEDLDVPSLSSWAKLSASSLADLNAKDASGTPMIFYALFVVPAPWTPQSDVVLLNDFLSRPEVKKNVRDQYGRTLLEVIGRDAENNGFIPCTFQVYQNKFAALVNNLDVPINVDTLDGEPLLGRLIANCTAGPGDANENLLKGRASIILARTGIDVNHVGKSGNSALLYLSKTKMLNADPLFVQDPRVNVNQTDVRGRSAIFYVASQIGNLGERLSQRQDLDPNLTDPDGYTILSSLSEYIDRPAKDVNAWFEPAFPKKDTVLPILLRPDFRINGGFPDGSPAVVTILSKIRNYSDTAMNMIILSWLESAASSQTKFDVNRTDSKDRHVVGELFRLLLDLPPVQPGRTYGSYQVQTFLNKALLSPSLDSRKTIHAYQQGGWEDDISLPLILGLNCYVNDDYLKRPDIPQTSFIPSTIKLNVEKGGGNQHLFERCTNVNRSNLVPLAFKSLFSNPNFDINFPNQITKSTILIDQTRACSDNLVKLILDTGKADATLKDADGYTALDWAKMAMQGSSSKACKATFQLLGGH